MTTVAPVPCEPRRHPFWVFRRTGEKRFTFAWAPDPAEPAKRKQRKLPDHLKTEREALAYAREHEAELKAGDPTKARSSEPTIAELVAKWLALRVPDVRYAASTAQDARSNLVTWFVPRLGDRPATDIDVPTLRQWVRWVQGAPRDAKLRALYTAKPNAPELVGAKTIAAFTTRNILAAAAWFFDDVEGEGWARLPGGNPARARAVRSELPELRPRVGESHKLRLRQVADAQRVLDSHRVLLEHRARYALALTSPLRDGEIAGLKIADWDAETRIVHILRAAQLKSRVGKGTRLGKTKTYSSIRDLPIHPAAADAVAEWLADGWERLVGHPWTPADPLFPNAAGQHWRPDSAKFLRKDLEAVGLPTHIEGEPLTFHALRRSCASWLEAAGAPGEVVSVFLGHAPKTTADRHYAAKVVENLRVWVLKVGLVWTPGVCADASGAVCDEPLGNAKPLGRRAPGGRIRRARRQED